MLTTVWVSAVQDGKDEAPSPFAVRVLPGSVRRPGHCAGLDPHGPCVARFGLARCCGLAAWPGRVDARAACAVRAGVCGARRGRFCAGFGVFGCGGWI